MSVSLILLKTTMSKLVTEMSRQLAMKPSCTWRLDDDGYYATQCGQAFTAFAEGLDGNHYRYCPWCGRAIVEAHDDELVLVGEWS